MTLPLPQASVRYVGPDGKLTPEGLQYLLALIRAIEAAL